MVRSEQLLRWVMARFVVQGLLAAIAAVLLVGGLAVALLVKGDPTVGLDDGPPARSPAATADGRQPADEGGDGWAAPGGTGDFGGPRDPPIDRTGGDVPLEPVELDGDDATVALTGITAYREGMMLHVTVEAERASAAEPSPAEGNGPGGDTPPGPLAGPLDHQGGVLPPDVLSLGVAYPDGRSGRTEDDLLGEHELNWQAQSPVMTLPSTASARRGWRYDVWLWPRPEPGREPLELIVEWPGQGLDVRVELDAAAVAAAVEGSRSRPRS